MFSATRGREQEGFLEHERRGPAKLAGVDVTDVDAADQDPTPRRVVQAHQELRERRLADARWPDDRDRLVRVDVERHLVEHGSAVEAVCE